MRDYAAYFLLIILIPILLCCCSCCCATCVNTAIHSRPYSTIHPTPNNKNKKLIEIVIIQDPYEDNYSIGYANK